MTLGVIGTAVLAMLAALHGRTGFVWIRPDNAGLHRRNLARQDGLAGGLTRPTGALRPARDWRRTHEQDLGLSGAVWGCLGVSVGGGGPVT